MTVFHHFVFVQNKVIIASRRKIGILITYFDLDFGWLRTSQVYTYVSRIRKQETAKRPCGHQSQLHLVAIYLKILKVINLKDVK